MSAEILSISHKAEAKYVYTQINWGNTISKLKYRMHTNIFVEKFHCQNVINGI